MHIEDLLARFPKECRLTDGTRVVVRPLKSTDEKPFHQFFCAVPETERLLFKNRVTDPKVIRAWCQKIDYGRILPLVALQGRKVVADASLHQHLGGWKRHIGRISVVVHPEFRGRGVAKRLVQELMELARDFGLEKLEAEFMAEQQAARHIFEELGFTELVVLPDYVKDMQAIGHGYVLMGRHIITDEEYAAAN